MSWMLRLCRENGRRVAAQSYSTKHCAFTTIVYLLVTHADGSRGVWFISDRLPLRHLGIYIKQSTNFKYSIDHAKRSFYRSANAIFGRVGRIASEDITLQLINTKCIPILLYGLEACPLLKSDLSAIDFVINRLFMKLFRTCNIDVVKCCQEHFDFELPSVIWSKRVKKFEAKFLACNNLLCNIIHC